jgi:hypothetical protein
MAETRMQHWRRRGAELGKLRKAELCALYRRLGGMGGIHPPESWRKDEVITSITEIEWQRLPADQKLPDPPRREPPCDECGTGSESLIHQTREHHYRNTYDPDKAWVPVSEAEAERIAREFPEQVTEEQPEQPADATVKPLTDWDAERPVPDPRSQMWNYDEGDRGLQMWLNAGDSVRLTINSAAGPLLDQTLAHLAVTAKICPEGEILRYTYRLVNPETGQVKRGAARIVIEPLDVETAPGSHNPGAVTER